MWPITYDKWNELWIVGEFDRQLEPKTDSNGYALTYYFRVDAEKSAHARNNNRRRHGEEWYSDDAEFGNASEVWPGGAVRYGVSLG